MTQKEKSEATRQIIIEQAAKLFVKKGFYGTSIAELSKTVGLTKGAIYHHFKNKDDLCFEVVDYVRNAWGQKVGKFILKEQDPETQMIKLFDYQAQMIHENPILCLVMNGLVIELDGSNDYLMRKIRSMYTDFALFIEKIIIAGQKKKYFRNDLDTKFMAMNIVGMIRGNSCSHVFDDIDDNYFKKMETLRNMVIGSLRV